MEKVKEEEFIRVCRLAKLVERNAKIATFTTVDQMEGLELSLGKIITFWVKNPGTPDQEKIYSQPIHNKQIAAVIGAFELKNQEPLGTELDFVFNVVQSEQKASQKAKEDVKDMGKKDETENKAQIRNVIELPDVFTFELISKWSKMTTMERMLNCQRTPKSQIKELPTKRKSVYVPFYYMLREANYAFLFDWNFSQLGISIGDKSVCVYGTLTANIDGKIYSKPAVGYEDINASMTIQLCIKSATSNAIKNGLSMFQFNSDVYGGGDNNET